MIFSLYEASGRQEHITGASAAQNHMSKLRQRLSAYLEKHDSTYVILDYSGIESITGSYARHTIGWLLLSGAKSVGKEFDDEPISVGNGTISLPLPIYPFVSGISLDVRDELKLALSMAADMRLCFMQAVVFDEENVTEAHLIGDLENSLRETLILVMESGETSATDLFDKSRRNGSGNISATAWNNRLADLHRLRILRRRKEGRHWLYSPVASQITIIDDEESNL